MKRIIRLTENDLVHLVKKVISEQSSQSEWEGGEGNIKYESFEDMEKHADFFRTYVNQYYPKLAKSLNLSKLGPKNNDIIKKAWTYQTKMGDTQNLKELYKTLGEIFMNEIYPKTDGLRT